ncbi:MAG: DNA mismatch repair protein MutS [Flavobacterium sp.]|uniref:Smr/MutS family protein n=1 Tax=Flavobacterium sp. TaxID=239 RepID=UPI00352884E9
MIKIGDNVSVLDDAIDGVVKRITGKTITVETTDGFDLNFQENELIIIGSNKLNISFNKSEIVNQKEIAKPNYVNREKKSKKEIPVPDFDLHIEKLVKNYKSLSNHEILTIQSETAKRHIDFAIRNRIPKIVLIHGVGEGILKSELDFLLDRYEGVTFREANYQKYGQGATEIYFKQNK